MTPRGTARACGVAGEGETDEELSEPPSGNRKNILKRRQCNNALAPLKWHRGFSRRDVGKKIRKGWEPEFCKTDKTICWEVLPSLEEPDSSHFS